MIYNIFFNNIINILDNSLNYLAMLRFNGIHELNVFKNIRKR